MNSNYFESSGSTLCFEVSGEGDPILLLAGGPGLSAEYMSELVEPLSKNFQVILYHQRGTGKSISDKPLDRPITLSQYIEDLESLREHLNINKWDILGHSWGAILASAYTAQYAKRVEKLIFVNTGGLSVNIFTRLTDNVIQRLSGETYLTAIDLLTRFQSTNNPNFLIDFFIVAQPAYFYNKSLAPEFAKQISLDFFSVSTYLQLLNNLLEISFDLDGKLSDFEGELLFIKSRQDIIGFAPLVECKDNFGNFNLKVIEKAGHYVWIEQPEEFFSIITEFLTKNRIMCKPFNLTGNWSAEVKQKLHGDDVDFTMEGRLQQANEFITGDLAIGAQGLADAEIENKKNISFNLVLKGTVSNCIVKLDYCSIYRNVKQTGLIICEIDPNDRPVTKFTGKFVGYGPLSEALITGDVTFTRK